jgi:GntR family hexuronate regulon transcriptional repressor
MQIDSQDTQKLYQKIALAIAATITDGRYTPGQKLPSERELADEFGVSRPTIRDAMIALEFQGLVEARQGSGVYVTITTTPIPEDTIDLEVNALEWTEARRLFEGEACALSAAIATEEQLTSLERLVNEMDKRPGDEAIERLEREFHVSTALATNNAAIVAGVEELWDLRQQSPVCAAMLRRARNAGGDFIGEHRQITKALRDRDSKAAREAIHSHLGQVIDNLLTLAETDALQQTRQKIAEQRRAVARRNEI